VTYTAHVVHVFIASPGDVHEERDALRREMWEHNARNTPTSKVVLLPRMWETDSIPTVGQLPQDILDEQLVDTCDLVVGIFWTRIGQLMPDKKTAASEHEIDRVVAAKKPALLYFSRRPVAPETFDEKQMKLLRKYKDRMGSSSIYHEFDDPEEFARRAVQDIVAKVRDGLRLEANAPEPQSGLAPYVMAYLELEPQNRHFTNLIIRNFGTAPAFDIRPNIDPRPQTSPDSEGRPIQDLPIPDTLSCLVPGQEWKAVWDYGPKRSTTDLPTKHTANLTYRDVSGKEIETTTVLDFDQLTGQTWLNT
jgi:hypothetical protein